MPYKNPEAKKKYDKAYRILHYDEIREQRKQHYWEHREECLAQSQNYRLNNPEKYALIKRRNYLKVKLKVFGHYCLGKIVCANCGITDIDVLCLDHINGGGTKQRKEVGGGTRFWYWLIRNDYPTGLQVLCANCNLKKRYRLGV